MLWARESRSRNPISRPRSRRPAARRSRRKIPRRSRKPAELRAGQGKRFAMAEPVYRRVVVKLSGEYFAGAHSFGMDQATIERIGRNLRAAKQLVVEVAVVVGER